MRKSAGIYWDDAFIHLCSVKFSSSGVEIEQIITHRRELNENLVPLKPISEDIKILMEESGPLDGTWVVGLPEKSVMYRPMARPFSDRKKITSTIGAELETLLPAGEEKLLYDFIVTGKDSSDQTLFNVVAAYGPSVQDRIAEMNSVGIDPEIVDSCAAAMIAGARNVFNLSPDSKYALVHIGKEESSLVVFHGQEVRLIDGFPFGLNRISGSKTSHEEPEIVENSTATIDLAREIGLSLYRIDQKVQGYVLIPTGYARYIKDFAKTLEETLSVRVENPISDDLAFDGSTEKILDSFMAVSLAFRAIDKRDLTNFRQRDLGYTRKTEELKRYVISFGGAFLALLFLWVGGLSLDVYLKGKIREKLDARIKKEFVSVMPKGTPMVEPVKQMEQYLSRRSKEAGIFDMGGAHSPLDVMSDISTLIPLGSGTVIDSMSIDLDEIALSGKASSYNEVDTIKSALAKLSYITEAKVTSANVDRADQAVTFKIVCKRGI